MRVKDCSGLIRASERERERERKVLSLVECRQRTADIQTFPHTKEVYECVVLCTVDMRQDKAQQGAQYQQQHHPTGSENNTQAKDPFSFK